LACSFGLLALWVLRVDVAQGEIVCDTWTKWHFEWGTWVNQKVSPQSTKTFTKVRKTLKTHNFVHTYPIEVIFGALESWN
jgi:hypothetical protein